MSYENYVYNWEISLESHSHLISKIELDTTQILLYYVKDIFENRINLVFGRFSSRVLLGGQKENIILYYSTIWYGCLVSR
jgi:hypothetical protein